MKRLLRAIPACLLLAATPLFAGKVAVVAVDVGHFREKPGATSARGVSEFEFNAALAEEIAQALASAQVRPLLIGADGSMADLAARAERAKSAGAGFLLSVHHDSVKPAYFKPWVWHGAIRQYADDFSGFGLFVSRKNAQFGQSLKCASAIGAKLQQAGFRHSTYHADKVAGEGREWADQANGVYYYDDLIVLKTAAQPAVLLEAGVIVNRGEEQALARPETREKIAHAVKAGLAACGAV